MPSGGELTDLEVLLRGDVGFSPKAGAGGAEAKVAQIWQRAAPFVMRAALEDGVRQALGPGFSSGRSSMRAQLLCLPHRTRPDIATEVTYLWSELSDWCHYGWYRADPSLTMLLDRLERCRTLIESLNPLGPTAEGEDAQGRSA